MKILFLVGKYYPVPSPNGICVERIMNACRKAGDEPICLCCHHGDEPEFEILDGIPVHRARCGFYSCTMHSWRKLPRWKGFPLRAAAGLWDGLGRLLHLFSWPFRDATLYRRYLRIGTRLCRGEQIGAVFAVNDPLESAAAGAELKRRFPSLKLTINYIDALSGGNRVRSLEEKFGARSLPARFCARSSLRWERFLGNRADRIIAMEAAQNHDTKHWQTEPFFAKTVFLNVPYFNPALLTPPKQKKTRDKIEILFCGNLYALRDPGCILAIAEHLRRPDLRWKFIGGYKKIYEKRFQRAREILGENLVLMPFVPHEELIRHIESADVLLNIGERLPSVVAGKLFEYISYGKPIVSTFPIRDNSGIPILEKYPNALLLYDETPTEDSAEQLSRFLAENLDKPIDPALLAESYRTATPEAYVENIGGEVR